MFGVFFFFFTSRRRHTICSRDWCSDVCSSDLMSRALEIRLRDLPRAEQQAAERVRVAADFGVDDGAVLEVDRPGVVPPLGGDAQHAGLPAQVEQLEDVMDPELAQRAFDRHGYAASEAKMCCRSSAVRACMRARCANGPLGSSRVTRSHAWTASA